MFALIPLAKNAYYINSPARMGVYRTAEKEAWLIDSGEDAEAGMQAWGLIQQQGWRIRAIINTHSHADHIGGNQWISGQTGCPVYAAGVERAFLRQPELEPSLFYGGYPFAQARNKYLVAPPSYAQELTQDVLPDSLELLHFPGHFFNCIGVKTTEGVYYLGDAVSGVPELKTHPITYVYDVERYLQSLAQIEAYQGTMFVPAHTEPTQDIGPHARATRQHVLENVRQIKTLLGRPMGFDDLLAALLDQYGLNVELNDYLTFGSSVRSYLSYLGDRGEIAFTLADNRLIWRALR